MYAKIKNGSIERYPYSIRDLVEDNPNTSFASNLDAETLEQFGVVRVVVTSPPEHDRVTETAIEAAPLFSAERGQWEQAWTIASASESEVAQRIAYLSQEARSRRNVLLINSDWTQVADAPVDKAAWAAYRQALRDVTSQSKFPLEIDWPESPT